METVMREIDVIAFFDKNGDINPIRFRYCESSSVENKVIQINKVLTKKQEFYNGNLMYVFECRSFLNNRDKLYEIKYEINKNKWYLSKI